MKHAAAILTYAPTPAFNCRLETTLRSLRESKYPGKIYIVDDGSPNRDLSFYRRQPNVQVVVKPYNVGVARGKNTSIRLLIDDEVDVGFLLDDDMIFKQDWWDDYLDVHERSDKIHHLSWANRGEWGGAFYPERFDGVQLVRTEHLNGCMLTFTPTLIATIGGFWVTPLKWGWDHVNWTHRAREHGMMPFFADVPDPQLFLGEMNNISTVTESQKRECDKYHFDTFGPKFQPLIE